VAKEMENQMGQWGKICTGDIYHPQRNVPTSDLERLENPQAEDAKWDNISIAD